MKAIDLALHLGPLCVSHRAGMQFSRIHQSQLNGTLVIDSRTYEMLFVDRGRTMLILAAAARSRSACGLFVSAMGARGCTWGEAARRLSLPDWAREPRASAGVLSAGTTVFVPTRVSLTRSNRY